MKLIIAIIPSHKLENVIHELDLIQVYRKTVSNVLGPGKSHTEVYRGMLETGNLVKKVRFEIAISDGRVEEVIQAILRGAKNEEGDGKIFVVHLADCIQLGTHARGSEAIGQ